MFPPEIFDTILDDVHELDNTAVDVSVAGTFPQKTLSTCALVCKSWLPRARHLGFEEVLFPNDDATVGVTFCALLDHPLCTFRAYVRTLKLREPYRCPSELMKRQWLRTVLPRLATLPNVEYLHLKDMWFHQVSETDWADIVLPLFGPHLKKVMIFSTYFTRPSDVVELVSRCTQLEVLKLASLTMTMDRCSRQDIAVYPPPSRKLRKVLFHGEEALDVIHWLVSASICTPPPSLSIISFEDITSPSCIVVARCLDSFGSSITSLTLGFSEDGTYTDTEGMFSERLLRQLC